ncbi:hypothetical protein [Sorangium sp. So ce861]|uniref:hypothetical protein n=1 Tax=Sorangium sp. So ce861 TaxID=3133323 RepID=UPI003F6257BE
MRTFADHESRETGTAHKATRWRQEMIWLSFAMLSLKARRFRISGVGCDQPRSQLANAETTEWTWNTRPVPTGTPMNVDALA